MQDNGFDITPAAPATVQEQYGNPLEAYYGILDANNQFAGQEGLDALRALPQLLRRQNLRQQFGIANLTEDRVNAVIQDFEELYASRLRNAAEAENRRLTPPGPEGQRNGGIIRLRKGGKPYRKEDYPLDPRYLAPEPPAILQGLSREEEFDDGAFKFQGSQSDRLGLTPRVFPRHPESDTSPQSHMDREIEVFKPRMQYYSSGGVNKVRPTPNVPSTPAKQNPNTTDYVPRKPVDEGFKETLERIRGRSQQDLPDNYRAGGSISIDEMKYALMKGR
jgi:hypothetical protein